MRVTSIRPQFPIFLSPLHPPPPPSPQGIRNLLRMFSFSSEFHGCSVHSRYEVDMRISKASAGAIDGELWKYGLQITARITERQHICKQTRVPYAASNTTLLDAFRIMQQKPPTSTRQSVYMHYARLWCWATGQWTNRCSTRFSTRRSEPAGKRRK